MTTERPHIVCAYTGVPSDCQECGGHDPALLAGDWAAAR